MNAFLSSTLSADDVVDSLLRSMSTSGSIDSPESRGHRTMPDFARTEEQTSRQMNILPDQQQGEALGLGDSGKGSSSPPSAYMRLQANLQQEEALDMELQQQSRGITSTTEHGHQPTKRKVQKRKRSTSPINVEEEQMQPETQPESQGSLMFPGGLFEPSPEEEEGSSLWGMSEQGSQQGSSEDSSHGEQGDDDITLVLHGSDARTQHYGQTDNSEENVGSAIVRANIVQEKAKQSGEHKRAPKSKLVRKKQPTSQPTVGSQKRIKKRRKHKWEKSAMGRTPKTVMTAGIISASKSFLV